MCKSYAKFNRLSRNAIVCIMKSQKKTGMVQPVGHPCMLFSWFSRLCLLFFVFSPRTARYRIIPSARWVGIQPVAKRMRNAITQPVVLQQVYSQWPSPSPPPAVSAEGCCTSWVCVRALLVPGGVLSRSRFLSSSRFSRKRRQGAAISSPRCRRLPISRTYNEPQVSNLVSHSSSSASVASRPNWPCT